MTLVIVALMLLTSPAVGAKSPRSNDRVVTYLSETGRGGANIVEWRVFDPVARTDTLFRSFSGHGPRRAHWDTAELYVEYLDSGTLFRIKWELGAQPWPEIEFPLYGDVLDWWFNRDSLCWEASAVAGVPRNSARGEAPYLRCHSELWQSNHDGSAWRIAQTETTDCGGCYFCEEWKLSNAGGIRNRPAIRLNQFEEIDETITIDGWGGTPEAIPPPAGESHSRFTWYFIPFRSAPARGLAFRIGQRSPNLKTFMVPFYLVDRRRGTQRLLETPALRRDEETWRMGMIERGGFLLVTGIRTYVYDLSTGDQIFHAPGYVRRAAVWTKRPSPARVDSLGLRRLRARFR